MLRALSWERRESPSSGSAAAADNRDCVAPRERVLTPRALSWERRGRDPAVPMCRARIRTSVDAAPCSACPGFGISAMGRPAGARYNRPRISRLRDGDLLPGLSWRIPRPFLHVGGRDYPALRSLRGDLPASGPAAGGGCGCAEYRLHRNDPGDPGYRRFLARLVDPLRIRLAPAAAGWTTAAGSGGRRWPPAMLRRPATRCGCGTLRP